MSSSFSSDEFLLKRSLFGSIFGVANRLKRAKTPAAATAPSFFTTAAREGQQQQQQQFDEPIQPCSSSQQCSRDNSDQSLWEIDNLIVGNEASPIHSSAAYSPTAQLGTQLNAQLQFEEEQQRDKNHLRQKDSNETSSNDKTSKTISREQIYAEIVRECNELEKKNQQQQSNNNHNQQQKDDAEKQQHQQIMMNLVTQNLIFQIQSGGDTENQLIQFMLAEKSEMDHLKSHSSVDDQQLITGVGFSLDLERLIKVVITNVLKEMHANSRISIGAAMPRRHKKLAENLKRQQEDGVATRQEENAEQILEQKREKNNAAAARYRQRQKVQKDLLLKEVCQLEAKNEQLKAELIIMKREIDQQRSELWRKLHCC